LALSVHSLACHPLMVFDTDEQRQEWLPTMLCGRPACAGFPAWCQRTPRAELPSPSRRWICARSQPPRALPTPTSGRTAASRGTARTSDRFQRFGCRVSGIAAVAVGLARAASYARASGFGKTIIDHQGFQRWLTSTGAIALGTPIGMSGARITYCTALELRRAVAIGAVGCAGSRVKRRAVRAQRRSSTAFTSEVNTSVWKNCW
jgi:hypothetical protein